MAFTEEEIRAIVRTGEFSDKRAEDWLVRCLWNAATKYVTLASAASCRSIVWRSGTAD